MKKNKLDFQIIQIFSLTMLFVIGCSVQATQLTPNTTTISPLFQSEISPQMTNSPMTIHPSEPINLDATPQSGKANLRGHIETRETNVLLGELFLAKAVSTSNPEIDLLELDETTAPRAQIDRATGNFIFINVEPGKYGLIAWEPLNSITISDPKSGGTLFIELMPNQITDIGTLYYP